LHFFELPKERSMTPRSLLGRLLLTIGLLALHSAAGAAGSAASAPGAGHAGVAGMPTKAAKLPPKPVKLIDINSAAPEQLKMLPGIGDAEAARIVAGRPYLSKADLVPRAGLPAGTYLALKRLVIARQTGQPKPKA
jgi:competence protein ComEA